MTLGVFLAIGVAALLAVYGVLRLLDLVLTFTDFKILIFSTETESTIARLRRDDGNRAAFEAIYAEGNDPWNSLSPRFRYQQKKYDAIMSFLPQRRFGRALDIGCGLGVLSRRLAARADNVLGLDLAEAAVARARARNADIPNMEFAQADIFDLPPELNGNFDLVLLADVLYYAPDTSHEAYRALAARVADLLKPGGVCIVCDHYFGWVMDAPTRLANMIHDAFRREARFGAITEHWRPFYLVTLLTLGGAEVARAKPAKPNHGRKLSALLAGLALIGLVVWIGARQIGLQVLSAGWAIPLAVLVHLAQLALSSFAWKSVSSGGTLSGLALLRLRIMREGINSLLPVAQIGGVLVNIRLLAQRGVKTASAAAGGIVDLWTEGVAQAFFILAGLMILASLGRYPVILSWLGGVVAVIALGLAGLGFVQRSGLLQKLEDWALRQAGAMPLLSADSLRGFDGEIRRRLQHRGRILSGVALHLLSWMLGTAEVWLILMAIGSPVTPAEALVIESLGTAVRSGGFLVPAALGVQEGGFILACSLFGLAPVTAVALSMVKRMREILIGIAGLVLWWRAEWKHRFAPAR